MYLSSVFRCTLLGFQLSGEQQTKNTHTPGPHRHVTVVVTRYAFMHMARVRKCVRLQLHPTSSTGLAVRVHQQTVYYSCLDVSRVRSAFLPNSDDSETDLLGYIYFNVTNFLGRLCCCTHQLHRLFCSRYRSVRIRLRPPHSPDDRVTLGAVRYVRTVAQVIFYVLCTRAHSSGFPSGCEPIGRQRLCTRTNMNTKTESHHRSRFPSPIRPGTKSRGRHTKERQKTHARE